MRCPHITLKAWIRKFSFGSGIPGSQVTSGGGSGVIRIEIARKNHSEPQIKSVRARMRPRFGWKIRIIARQKGKKIPTQMFGVKYGM